MDKSISVICRHLGCQQSTAAHGYCSRHLNEYRHQKALQDRQRPNAQERGYGAIWRRYRRRFLMEHPLCAMHLMLGELVPSTVVDHITPHKNNPELFWQEQNHQALCKHCHDSHKQRFEKSGAVVGSNDLGLPLNPNHHWNLAAKR